MYFALGDSAEVAGTTDSQLGLVLLAIACIDIQSICLLIFRFFFLGVSTLDRDVTACFLNQLLLAKLWGT